MTQRELCANCGGNGVVRIPGGVSVCDMCHGECWSPDTLATIRALDQQNALLLRTVDMLTKAEPKPALVTIDAVPEDSHMPSLKQRTGCSVRLNPRTRDLSIEQPNGGDASNELFPDGYVLIVSVPDQL